MDVVEGWEIDGVNVGIVWVKKVDVGFLDVVVIVNICDDVFCIVDICEC